MIVIAALMDGVTQFLVTILCVGAVALLVNLAMRQREAPKHWLIQDEHTLEFVAAIEFIDGPEQAPTVTEYTLDPCAALVFEFRDAHIILREDDEERLNLIEYK